MKKDSTGTGLDKDRQKLSPFDCIIMGIGSIIGAGIFAVAPIAMRQVGNGIVIAFLLAAMFVFFKTIPEMIISSSLPANGGAYMHLSRLLHPGLAVVQAFNQLVVGSMKVASLALTFAEYFSLLAPKIPPVVTALVITVIFTVISLFGIKTSAMVQNVSVLILLIALGTFAITGWGSINIQLADIIAVNIKMVKLWAVMGMLHGSLIGANVLMYAADEIENPGRTIPIAFTVSTVICTVIYAVICFVTVGNQAPPADFKIPFNFATVAEGFMSKGLLTFFITGGALLAVVTSINAVILMFSRSHFVAARDGLFPGFIAKINTHGVPSAAIWLNSIIAMLGIASGFNLDDVTRLTSIPGLFLGPLLFLSIFALPKRYPLSYKYGFLRIPHWVSCILVVIASVFCFLLGGSVMKDLSPRGIVSILLFYGCAIVYTLARRSYIKKTKNTDLFETMRTPYEPWNVQEAAYAKELAETGTIARK